MAQSPKVAPTLYVIASDQHRNGKTLLARIIADYLLLDGRDPFLIDTDAPDGPLRAYFPGRTALADFAAITGQMKLFDTILGSPGRDYVIDLPIRHTENFFAAERDLHFFRECHTKEFRVFLFFIVDNSFTSQKMARSLQHHPDVDLFVPVRNMMVRSSWPEGDGALTLPFLPAPVALAISNKRFSLRNFVQGDTQGLGEQEAFALQSFLYEVLGSLTNLEPALSLKGLLE
jgi:hypothetical protein